MIKIKSEIENNTPRIIFGDNGLGFNMESVRDKIFRINQAFHANRQTHLLTMTIKKTGSFN